VFHALAIYIVSSFFQHPTFGSTLMVLKGAVAFGLTILLASLSYRYFETPFLRLKKRHEVIASRPIQRAFSLMSARRFA
jgi:peptidoglycan/LPS O-acetylase OafA/YrhL